MWAELNALIYVHGLFIFNSFDILEIFIIDSNSKAGTKLSEFHRWRQMNGNILFNNPI